MMKKLAIVSTYNENCGNASYTHALKCGFSKYVDVNVFGLELSVLQSTSPSLVKAGDRHILSICEKLKEYDYVNIQFEAGLYGRAIKDIYRRISWLIQAAPNLTITFHRVDIDSHSWFHALKVGVKAKSYKKYKAILGAGVFANLTDRIIKKCKVLSKEKNIVIKVHTRRDVKSVKNVYGYEAVFDYPLVFLTPGQISDAWSLNESELFRGKHGLGVDDVVIGIFGYISEYKGIETVISALQFLPDNFKLVVFGSQHPQTIKRNELISPYIESLHKAAEELDEKHVSQLHRKAKIEWLSKHSAEGVLANDVDFRKISSRLHFVGGLPDPEFIEALRLSDICVLPYLEVGQSMSGVVVLGMEAGGNIICANNFSFFETAKYYPDSFHTFDMGNAIELAQKIRRFNGVSGRLHHLENRKELFKKWNIDGSIRLQLEKFGFEFK